MTTRRTRTYVAGLLLSVACDQGSGAGYSELDDPLEPPSERIEEIKEHEEWYFGREVSLTGEVDEVFSERAFELEDMDWIFDEEILVVTRRPVRLGRRTLTDDDEVRVRGTVKEMVTAEIEMDIGWELPVELEADFENRPVVIATAIDAIHEYARWDEEERSEGEFVSLYSLYGSSPEELVDMPVMAEAVAVNEVTGSALWVGTAYPGVMVVPTEEVLVAGIEPGDEIDLRGTVTLAPPVTEAMVLWDLAEEDAQSLSRDRVYVAADELRERTADVDDITGGIVSD